MTINDPQNDGDEYLDAFCALGGQSDKSGYIEKNRLIQIIREEFALTIDMVVSAFPFLLCVSGVPS